LLSPLTDEDEKLMTHLLGFLTGSDSVPPLGFVEKPSLQLHREEDPRKDFPVVSVCTLSLTLPLCHSLEEFKQNFKNAMQFRLFTDV
jgi:hypothetical protein